VIVPTGRPSKVAHSCGFSILFVSVKKVNLPDGRRLR
jgi:hypothetical protein